MEKGRHSGSDARIRSETGGGSGGSGGGTASCRICGQRHAAHEPHVYDYVEEVDEDLTCYICLQPFVTPLDIPCGHTFCGPCLNNYLRVQQICPIDRKPLSAQLCFQSSIVLRKWVYPCKITIRLRSKPSFLDFKLSPCLYVVCFFFCVIPRRLNFVCRRLGTLCLFHFHRQVDVEWLSLRNVGVFIREKVWLENSLSLLILGRLNFICRRFGTLRPFHLHRQVGVEWLGLRNIGVFIREKVWLENSLSLLILGRLNFICRRFGTLSLPSS